MEVNAKVKLTSSFAVYKTKEKTLLNNSLLLLFQEWIYICIYVCRRINTSIHEKATHWTVFSCRWCTEENIKSGTFHFETKWYFNSDRPGLSRLTKVIPTRAKCAAVWLTLQVQLLGVWMTSEYFRRHRRCYKLFVRYIEDTSSFVVIWNKEKVTSLFLCKVKWGEIRTPNWVSTFFKMRLIVILSTSFALMSSFCWCGQLHFAL